MPTLLLDGRYATGFYVGRPNLSYPFAKNGDYNSIVITREWRQSEANFTPGVRGVLPDPKYGLARLILETEPRPTGIGDLVAVTRTFARVPAQQVVYSTVSITKPTPAAYATALNMLLVTGSGTSSFTGIGGYDYTGYLWDTIYSRVYGPYASTTGVDSGSDFRVTWTSHGLAGTERIAVYATIPGSSAWYLFSSSQYSVIDANTIDLLGWSTMSAASYAGKYYRDYTPGLDRVGCKLISDFYLPGVTAGITTPGDITIPSPLLNDVAFLAAVISTPTGYINYDAKELEQWLDSPIYQLDTVQINMSDV